MTATKIGHAIGYAIGASFPLANIWILIIAVSGEQIRWSVAIAAVWGMFGMWYLTKDRGAAG